MIHTGPGWWSVMRCRYQDWCTNCSASCTHDRGSCYQTASESTKHATYFSLFRKKTLFAVVLAMESELCWWKSTNTAQWEIKGYGKQPSLSFFPRSTWDLNPDTVTRLSTNRARRRLTSLIEANALTTTPDHQPVKCTTFCLISHSVTSCY